MAIRTALVIITESKTKEEKQTLSIVTSALRAQDISFSIKTLPLTKASSADLFIAVGGDGTFLAAAHLLPPHTPILGVNADPKRKEGFLLAANAKTFATHLTRIVRGTPAFKDATTLEAKVNGKMLPTFALNEFFVGSSKAYKTSRYLLSVGKKSEVHRSSGVIAATPLGVHAWASSALGMSVNIPKDKFMYVVREPYERRVFSDYRLKRGVLSKKDTLTIRVAMPGCIVVADSLGKEIPLKEGDLVSISLSKKTIRMIA